MPPVASPSLATDLYQLTMAAGYFHRGFAGHIATCELFVRRLPSARRFLVALGIDAALDYLEGLRFSEDDLRFLATVPALAGAMTPDRVLETVTPDVMARHLPHDVLWECIAAAAERAGIVGGRAP